MQQGCFLMLVWACNLQGKLYICMEYASGGNLYEYIHKQTEQLPEERVWQLFIQVTLCRAAAATHMPVQHQHQHQHQPLPASAVHMQAGFMLVLNPT